ncbi:DUF7919 family protein [Anaeromyxobacter oryzisoli]|uniref:DUF7919 family protein n=1 Tax=Anaeromyxobacter oryzisoli TaxID=2925408 RepID=UPI001F599E37|nr:hypothetical protein [Anaeromyxobacter sp. SG63]
MIAFADLGPIEYFLVGDPSALRAVGWLARGQPFRTGAVGREFFDKLCVLLVSPFQPIATAGVARCDLCQFSGGPDVIHDGDVVVQMGASNLFVPGSGVLYVAPSLIAHYIDAHDYRPPDEFVEAVLRCPQTHSMEYKRLLLANGGSGLVAPPRAGSR